MNKIMNVTNKSMQNGSIQLDENWFQMEERPKKYLGYFNKGDIVEVSLKDDKVAFIKKTEQTSIQNGQPDGQITPKDEKVEEKPSDYVPRLQFEAKRKLDIFRGQCLNLAHAEMIALMNKNNDIKMINTELLFKRAEEYVKEGEKAGWLE